MLPATWQRTNPTEWGNERGGTDAPFGPALAEMPEARYAGRLGKGPAIAAMPDTRIYTKIADTFNTEDAASDMAADESCESGE